MFEEFFRKSEVITFKLITIGFLCLLFIPSFAQKKIELNNWTFYENGSKKIRPAKVPGSVLNDLLNCGVIENPYNYYNEEKVKWVEEKTWIYNCKFNLDTNAQCHFPDKLVFEGLDTYAKVFVNDSLVLYGQNMFLSYQIPLKGMLRNGMNDLRVEFEPTVRMANEKRKKSKLPYPGDERIYVRKAQYQFGWDWGPRLINCGIWKEVYLTTQEKIPDIQFYLSTRIINDSLAEVNVQADCYSKEEMSLALSISIAEISLRETDLIALKKGKNKFNYKLRIQNPKLWWCNEYGNQHLYHTQIEIRTDSLFQNHSFQVGIREITINQTANEKGSAFTFELNGKPIFCKGANFIPPDALRPEGNKDQLKTILTNAASAHMNMVRVWGGGVYPSDYFYFLCDSLGLLVWQDFMFACAMYPYDENNVKEIEAEISQQLIKYRNHASLALWCGNNENYEGWTNWGWQKQYNISSKDSVQIINQYLELFNVKIPSLVNKLAKNTLYKTTSPDNGWGRKIAYMKGDVHYWGVWWGMAPIESFASHTGRFVSEYGFQGFPSKTAIEKMSKTTPRNWLSAGLKTHQKHPKGFETIEHYLRTYFRYHHDFEKNRYLSQILQAFTLETAIKAHRINKPHCMGTLYWQLNDCWPVISWSTADYFQIKKASHYSVQKKFVNVLPVIQWEGGHVNIHLISDSVNDVRGKLRITQYNLDGRVEEDVIVLVEAKANTNNLIKRFDEKTFLKTSFDSMKTYLVARLFIDDVAYSSDVFFFCRPNQLMLQEAIIEYKIDDVADGYKISLFSKTPAFWVSLGLSENEKASENFFHLLPYEEKNIFLRRKNETESKPTIHPKSLYEFMRQ